VAGLAGIDTGRLWLMPRANGNFQMAAAIWLLAWDSAAAYSDGDARERRCVADIGGAAAIVDHELHHSVFRPRIDGHAIPGRPAIFDGERGVVLGRETLLPPPEALTTADVAINSLMRIASRNATTEAQQWRRRGVAF